MGRNWTDKQLKAITEKGDILVSAAAGAGKTAVLTERIARLVAEGTGVDELLVVTFTKAAAAEMKQRIESRLNELANAADEGEDKALASRLRSAAFACNRANISTIHSFCTSVLRRNYNEAGIDPAVTVAEAADFNMLMEQALDTVLEEEYAANETSRDAGFEALIAVVKNDDNLVKLIKGLYSFAIARPDPTEWLDKAANMYSTDFDKAMESISQQLISISRTELRNYMQEAKRLRLELPDNQRGIAKALDSDMSQMLALSMCEDYEKWHKAIGLVSFERLAWASKTKDEVKTDAREYRDGLKNLINKTIANRFKYSTEEEARFAVMLSPPVLKLCRLTRRFIEKYNAMKAEQGFIDYSDMEQLTLRVLKNDDIAREYRNKFRYVFVDEYQDINPAQEAILNAISQGNRFMVGDVKQSIYRFRQAEPAIFLEKYSSYTGAEGKIRIDLNRNFRSKTVVLDAVNLLFSQLMKGSVGEIDYSDNAALVTGLEQTAPQESYCEVALIDASTAENNNYDDEDDAPDKAEAEAIYAASRILDIMNNETYTENGVTRKYRWSDFTILLRSAKGVSRQWLSKLTSAGIPCVSDVGTGYLEAIEVRVLLDLLRVIDNRRQDIPLLAVMRSPIYGFLDADLIHIRADYEGGDILERVIEASKDPNQPTWSIKAARMLSDIERWRGLGRIIGIGELIGIVLDETRYEVYCSAWFGGAARFANIEYLLNKARKYASRGMAGLHGYLRYIDNSADSAAKESTQKPVADAVRLTSIHSSKGLEFPVVIIGGIARRFNRSYQKDVGIFDSELGIGLFSVYGDRKKKSILQRAIADREATRQTAEEMRALYVGMTRAKEKLIMVGALKKAREIANKNAVSLSDVRINASSGYLEWMLGAYFPNGVKMQGMSDNLAYAVRRLDNGGEIRLYIMPNAYSRLSDGRITQDNFQSWLQDAAFADSREMDELFLFNYPYNADVLLPSKLSVTELNSGMTEREEAQMAERPRFMESEREITGAYIGALTHKLMQLISIKPHTNETVKAELKALVQNGIFTADEASLIRIEPVAAFFCSELGERLIASPRVERERAFNIMLGADTLIGASSSAPIMLQGIIDCCFIENGEWVLVDHKTNRVDLNRTARTVAMQYQRQIALYAEALQRLTGIPVKEKYIYMLSVGESVRL